MTKLFINLMILSACVVFLTSCGTLKSYDFKTAGIMKGDSSYLVTASGRHVDATTIDVKPGKVTVDGKPYPLDSISSIRSKQMYFGVSNGKMFLGETYGKINLLYELISVPTYGSPYGSVPGSPFYNTMVTGHNTTKKYYIQKNGSTVIDKMTVGSVIDYVSDNEEALEIANGARNWKRGYLASWLGVVGGSVYALKNVFSTGDIDANGHVKSANLTGPFIVLAATLGVMGVTSVTYQVRMLKAIEQYNK